MQTQHVPMGQSLGRPEGQSCEAKPAPSCQVLIAWSGVFTCQCCRFPPDNKRTGQTEEFPAGPRAGAPPSPLRPSGSPAPQVARLQEGHKAALPP